MKCIECDKPNATHQCINCDSFYCKECAEIKDGNCDCRGPNIDIIKKKNNPEIKNEKRT